ncbi:MULTISPECIES: LysE family translocator [Edaphosphingomonas]|uniref:LysE family translocator n=2 Tax=Edaphosphingomonas TaxID=3423724 RepID=A0A2T4HP63_9SPHN|nr:MULTISPECIES: LysE family translocator [Sphingomonas]MDX3885902.1 LysE family translocator [Sphingomonas sp.]OHT21946.1 Homoserine/homoserine lactone efflux protein [Sphingomonas haloaromaticamans]PTD17567.1 LysE family translocator [Sphingomonas fennica]
MSLHTWWLFFLAVFLLCGTPGPNMLHVMTRSVHFGARRSVAAMAGCLAALVLILLASATGLSALLMASPRLFDVLRYAGVAYLVYLGIRAWRSDAAPIDVDGRALVPSLSPPAMFRGGFAIGISNPKALMFAAAFLPQFIDKARPEIPQFAILVATFAVTEMFWYAVYGIGGQKLAGFLTRPGLKRAFNRLTGGIFIGFGLALLGSRP